MIKKEGKKKGERGKRKMFLSWKKRGKLIMRKFLSKRKEEQASLSTLR